MAAGDINDPLSDIPGITLRDDTDDPTDQGAGFALLKFKNGKLIWLPNGGAVRYALDNSSVSQLAGLTEEASPADADLFLMERASDGAKRKVQAQNLPGGGGGGEAASLLAYRAAVDIFNATALTADTWTSMGPSHNITVGASGSRRCMICLRLEGLTLNSMGPSIAVVRLNLDSGTYLFLDGPGPSPLYSTFPQHTSRIPGGLVIPQLSAGAHTIQPEVKSCTYGSNAYCRPSSLPTMEFFELDVIQLP